LIKKAKYRKAFCLKNNKKDNIITPAGFGSHFPETAGGFLWKNAKTPMP